MPIYEYNCIPCDKSWKELHGADEKGGKCEICGEFCLKVLPKTNTIKTSASVKRVGQTVEKYIEETREAVKQQLEEARKDYNP